MVNYSLHDIGGFGKLVPPGREEAGASLQPPADIMGVENKKNISDIVVGYDDPHAGWESHQVKDLLKTETENWAFGLADWKSFITLTFKDEKTPDVAGALFKWFIRQNNEHAFGKNYSRKVGHSYFSYLMGMERTTLDVVHLHAVVDKPLDFSFVHKFWGDRCGFAWIDGNLKSKAAAVNYVCKYTVKGGEIDPYVAQKQVIPAVLPDWWRDPTSISSRVSQGALFALGDLLKALDDMAKDNLLRV